MKKFIHARSLNVVALAAIATAVSFTTFAQSAKSIRSLGNQSQNEGKSRWAVNQDNMPGSVRAFQENLGQFKNMMNDWKVQYGCDDHGTEILFTDKGLIYYLPEKAKLSPEEIEDEKADVKKQEESSEEETRYKLVYHKVSVNWEGANTSPRIEAIGETPYYFGSFNHDKNKSIGHIKGFQKLVYHDLYPGVDVEFTFHSGKGIEYSLRVQPGYNASAFKMLYTGQNGLSLDGKGDLHIETAMGDILDHAPISSQNSKPVESAFEQLSNNEVGFKLGQYDKSSELVIDPWTVSPILVTYIPSDCGMDALNNVYVLEWGGGACYMQKYTFTGALAWTYNMTQYGFQTSISDMTIDPSGNTYTGNPYYYSNGGGGSYALLCLDQTGTLVYFNNTYNNSGGTVFENWNLGYSCQYGKLVEAGSPTVTQIQTGIMNAGTGSFNGPLLIDPTISELYAGCMSPNGTYYCLSSNFCFCTTGADAKTQTLVAYNISGTTPVQNWHTVMPNYNFADYSMKEPSGVPNNGVGASCADVYTSDGSTLNEVDATTGAVVKSGVTIPGGSNTLGTVNSGVAVDPLCGYVYAGGRDSIEIFDQNLVYVGSFKCPGIVYDISLNNGVLSAIGATTAGAGFVEQYNTLSCAGTPIGLSTTNASCGGKDGKASATPTFCIAPYTYLWSNGATTSSITGLSAGSYSVTVSSATSCITISDTFSIHQQGAGFTITLTPVDINCKSGNITTSISGGSNPFTYSWSNGATTSNILGVSPGKYVITVTDSAGCVDTASAVITSSGPTATMAFTNPTCVTTGTATATASGGTSPYTYSWSNGATTSSVTGLTAGTYSVTITDNAGCLYTLPVTVTNPPPPTITATPKLDSTCAGDSLTMTASGGKTYTWNPGGHIGSSYTVAPPGTTTYTVTGVDSNGCTGTATVTIKIEPAPAITVAPGNDSICKGGSLALTASGAASYTWSPPTGLSCLICPNPLATPTTTTTYKVVGVGANGCKDSVNYTVVVKPIPVGIITAKPDTICDGDSATLTASGGGSYIWTFSGSTADSVRVGPTTTTTYNLQVTLDGCTSITSKQVVVVGAVIPSISIAKDSVCKGDSTTITASGGLTYKWLPGGATTATITAKPPATTTYSCVITTACGKDTLTEKLTILPYPVIGLSHDTTICVGQSATLSATGGISYLWSNGATTSTISVAPGTTKTYTLAVSNGKCIKDTTVTVNVNNPPTITITPDQKVCQGSSVTLTATSTGSSYLWSNGATTSSITVTPTSTTTYTVTSSNGCPTKDSTEVFVLTPALTACCDTTIISGDTVTINAYGDVSYIWSPSTSLSCSTCPNPVASPTVTTTYTVVSTDSNGCKTSREVTVFVECVDFVVPNVFTPNNDGRNDDFVPYYIIGGTIHNGVGNVSSYTITIYDRWGKQVYNSSDPTKYWNGTLNNTNYLVPDGVYYYIIKATCGGNNYDHHGFVQVLGGGAK